MLEKLESCPFCGSKKVNLVHEVNYSYVTCDDCDAIGPDSIGFDEAIEKWNTRK